MLRALTGLIVNPREMAALRLKVGRWLIDAVLWSHR
jgi:hypothetical protein